MRVILSSNGVDISNRFSSGTKLRDILLNLGLLEEEVICIDRARGRLLLLLEVLTEDSDWEIREVLSKG